MIKKIISLMLTITITMSCYVSAFAYTRGEFASDLADTLGLTSKEWAGNQWFTDVWPNNAQYGPINWLKYEDIMTGNVNRSFDANTELCYNDAYNAMRRLDMAFGTNTLVGLLDAYKPMNGDTANELLVNVRKQLDMEYPDAAWRYNKFGQLKYGETPPGYVMDMPSNKAHAVIALTNDEWYTVYFGTNANYKLNGAGLNNPANFHIGTNGTYYLTFVDVFGNAKTFEIIVNDVVPEPEIFKSRSYGEGLSDYYKGISDYYNKQ